MINLAAMMACLHDDDGEHVIRSLTRMEAAQKADPESFKGVGIHWLVFHDDDDGFNQGRCACWGNQGEHDPGCPRLGRS